MPTVEGKAYWASVTRPNTTFDPVYQIDLAVDEQTAKSFKDSGVAVKTDELTNSDIQDWKTFRIENVRTGTCYLGHTDILVLPNSLASYRYNS